MARLIQQRWRGGRFVRGRARLAVATVGVVLAMGLVLTVVPAVSALDASRAAAGQVEACELLGGEAMVEPGDRTGAGGPQAAHVSCMGGLLDGMDCVTTTGKEALPPTVECVLTRVITLDGAQVQPGERFAIEPREPPTDLVLGGDARVPSVVAEDPAAGESVIVYNQSGSTVHDNAMLQIGLCGLLGGDATVETELTGAGYNSISVGCTGGLLDGMVCANDRVGTMCALPAAPASVDTPMVTPAAGVEVPVETDPAVAPTPTATPTDVPAPPTEPAAEPTVAPTTAPPPPPKVDGGPPSGPVDPNPDAPTPTPVILT